MNGYTDIIRRYAADQRFIGLLADADGTGEVGLGAEEAGRRLAVRFTLKIDQSTVATIRFQVFGCGFTIAACAAAAELVEGTPLATALALDTGAVIAKLGGLPEERGYCAELAVEALRAALQSAARNGAAVQTRLAAAAEADHGPRVSASDPVYCALISSPAPAGAAAEDRHLFACLLAVAAQESGQAVTLGLSEEELTALRQSLFPAANLPPTEASASPPELNPEVLELLLPHVPRDHHGHPQPAALWLAKALAARAAHPGHLWVAMGLFERPQLTAAIRRHLPTLAAANHQGMRWKRYLFKEVCSRNGGLLCKSPNCGVCSDYAFCFAPDS